jgi:hypothetical protein
METWRVVRNTVALHNFLKNHKRDDLVPANMELEQDLGTDDGEDFYDLF